MPHTVTLSDATFAKLQLLAVPLVDTTETVIDRLADEAVARNSAAPSPRTHSAVPSTRGRHVDPDHPESLTHTKVLHVTVDGIHVVRPDWNGLLRQVHIVALRRLGSFEAVKRISEAHLRPGRFGEDGFTHIPEADFSIQGVDSNKAWAYALGVARRLGIALTVEFEWRNKPTAAHPGEVGTLEWHPSP